MSYLDVIYDALIEEGIEITAPIQPIPGIWQRFRTKQHNKFHIYVNIHESMRFASVGDWISGIKLKVILNDIELSPSERLIYTEKIKQKAIKQQESIIKIHDIWDNCADADTTHPYLVRKQIRPYHIRQHGSRLVLPLYNCQMTIAGLQSIQSNGTKKFCPGSVIQGSFMLIGDVLTPTLRIVEGYATGVSVHMATDQLVCVAFAGGNLRNCTINMRQLFPEQKIIICADPKPIEHDYAINAASAIGAEIIAPLSLTSEYLDFNDIHVRYGLDALEGQLSRHSLMFI